MHYFCDFPKTNFEAKKKAGFGLGLHPFFQTKIKSRERKRKDNDGAEDDELF